MKGKRSTSITETVYFTNPVTASTNNVYTITVKAKDLFNKAPTRNGVHYGKLRVVNVRSKINSGAAATTQGITYCLWNQDPTAFADDATNDPTSKIRTLVATMAPGMRARGYRASTATSPYEGKNFMHAHEDSNTYTWEEGALGSDTVIGRLYVVMPDSVTPSIDLIITCRFSGQDTNSLTAATAPTYDTVFKPVDLSYDFLMQAYELLARDLTYTDGNSLNTRRVLRVVTIDPEEYRSNGLFIIEDMSTFRLNLRDHLIFPKPYPNGLMSSTPGRLIQAPISIAGTDEVWYAHSADLTTDLDGLKLNNCYQRERILTPENRTSEEILTLAANGSLSLQVRGATAISAIDARRSILRDVSCLKRRIPDSIHEMMVAVIDQGSDVYTAIAGLSAASGVIDNRDSPLVSRTREVLDAVAFLIDAPSNANLLKLKASVNLVHDDLFGCTSGPADD